MFGGVPADDSAPRTPSPGAAVLAVKIDNVAEARPHTGLSAAEVVYVEPVEGGLTRLLALYQGTPPEVVGPVRSARRSDVDLLAQHGEPVFAYSGAAPELLPVLRGARLVEAPPEAAAPAYFRDSGRRAPHDLFVRPSSLPDTARAPAAQPLEFGPTSVTGTPTDVHRVEYVAAAYSFTWSAETGRWAVSLDGTPLTSTESGQVTAATVIEQRVTVTQDEAIEDATGARSPVVTSVGAGSATVLRDGQRHAATWSRPDPAAPTRFHTTEGAPLPLSDYPVWVLLVPGS
ncbi:DUF3048 domain-containing protein [Actinokineospora sp. HBU206404]|uniref:DUF3048 domain-containing protein n=2 Tax=Actinokineospora xionganensis TaxID=2684470 RepID=A0ABR7L491_9PSEU|nr:DUF3048 domain-containing protein [Actinokineospora xionganensis]